MLVTQLDGHFEQTPGVVYDFLTDLLFEPNWNPDTKSIELVDGDGKTIGSKYRGNYRGMGAMEMTLVDCHRPDDATYECNGDKLDMRIVFRFKPENSGTHLTGEMEVEPKGFLRFLGPLMKSQMKKTLQSRPAQMRVGLAKYDKLP